MASSSTSSIQKSFKYDVFLSFRGEDTRKNFVDHLYHALEHKSIHSYKDDERITKGKRISDELITSIQDSRFYIIVFSKNYASSSWCLDELVKIMECQKTSDQTAYPVFYDVEPTEIRKQSGSVGEAFSKHEKQDAAGKWREALKEAADLAGWELKNTLDGHEAKFIQKIVEEISLELRFIDSSVDGKLIGMESRVKGVVSALETGSDDVRMIGIKGIGGGGKTTLARAVFDHISSWFEGKSFVENVREVSKASFSGLKELQKRVLSDVLRDKGIEVSSVHDGKKMMKKMMRGQKVLVVLDDVDNMEQLEALAGEPNWFKAGSRILITTRDEQVLAAHRVNLIHDVTLLSDKEAVCLFSRHAFGKEIPIQGYEELSGNVVSYAAGLPLTIRVLGSFLCGKDELEWKDAIDRLKEIPLRETLEKLELSYIGLEEDYKEIFLDVACILKGWIKDKAVEVLESCGFHARNGLRVLEQKSLITISEYGSYLGMHDHIEEMGKNIVRRLHPSEPNRHSRLWIQEEIEDILANDLGTEATRCIKMRMTRGYSLETFIKGLGNMKKLRVLDTSGGGDGFNAREVPGQCLPNALRYLRWKEYPFESLMKSFREDHLVGLSLPDSKIIQFWKGGERKVLKKLRFLDMDNSRLRTLDLEMIPNIKTVSLEYSPDLLEVHMPFRCPKLKSLIISYSKLRTLDLGSCPNLEMLWVDKCHDLLEVHVPFQCPKLESLSLTCPKLRTFEFGSTPDLETSSLAGCHDLLELYMRCPKLKSLHLNYSKLRTLNLGSCPNLDMLWLKDCHDLLEVHMAVRCPKLKSLSLNCSKLRTFEFGSTPDLETLSLEGCHDLIELHMPFRCPKLKSISLSDSKLRTLDLGLTPNLETLDIKDCFDLVEFHCPIGCSEKPIYLDFGGFEYILINKKIQSPEVGSLHLFVEVIDIRPLHSDSNLQKFLFSCFSRSICDLQCLRKLTLEGSIPEVPKDLDRLESLEELSLLSKKIQHLPDSICMLKHLKLLKLKSCWLIEKLPEDLGRLECLEDLYLTDCILLRDIPKSVCELKCLKYFHLPYCMLVEKLPEELGRLECLKELNIEGAGITHLPQSIFGLEGLRIIGSRWRIQSYGFTSMYPVLQNSSYMVFCYI